MANNPEPTKEPIPEKKKKRPIMALCMVLGAAEYANSRPATRRQVCHYKISLLMFRLFTHIYILLTWETRWNISVMHVIYFTWGKRSNERRGPFRLKISAMQMPCKVSTMYAKRESYILRVFPGVWHCQTDSVGTGLLVIFGKHIIQCLQCLEEMDKLKKQAKRLRERDEKGERERKKTSNMCLFCMEICLPASSHW